MTKSENQDFNSKPQVGKGGPGSRPAFRPRVVVKLYDWVECPYEDGIEQVLFKQYGAGPLEVRVAAPGWFVLPLFLIVVTVDFLRLIVFL